MAKMNFSAIMKIRTGNPYILVSAVRAKKLKADWKRPMPVLIRINGEPKKAWKINMMPVGNGSFYLYLHGDVRKASQTKAGDRVDVEIEFDSAYRNGPMHEMPDWFRVPLEKSKKARKNWDELTPSRQKEILRYFSALKSDEARERNLKKMMSILGGSPGRFMARDW